MFKAINSEKSNAEVSSADNFESTRTIIEMDHLGLFFLRLVPNQSLSHYSTQLFKGRHGTHFVFSPTFFSNCDPDSPYI